jgi:hypothetical protein
MTAQPGWDIKPHWVNHLRPPLSSTLTYNTSTLSAIHYRVFHLRVKYRSEIYLDELEHLFYCSCAARTSFRISSPFFFFSAASAGGTLTIDLPYSFLLRSAGRRLPSPFIIPARYHAPRACKENNCSSFVPRNNSLFFPPFLFFLISHNPSPSPKWGAKSVRLHI